MARLLKGRQGGAILVPFLFGYPAMIHEARSVLCTTSFLCIKGTLSKLSESLSRRAPGSPCRSHYPYLDWRRIHTLRER